MSILLSPILLISLVLCFIGLGFCGYMLHRNQAIAEFLGKKLKKMVPGDPDFNKHWEEYEKYDYDIMMKKFWVWPLDKLKGVK